MQRRRVSVESRPVPDWIAQPERGSRLALLAYVRLALALGRPAARVLLYPVSVYFLVFAAKARNASRTYLRKALAREPGVADIYRHFLTFASTILDRVFLLKGRYSDFEVRTYGEEIVADLVAQGGGCFLLGAHMGSFEVVRALGGDAHGLRVSLVMYEENARKLSSVLNAIEPDIAPRIIALGKMDAMLKVEQALERGEFVGMLGDRTIAGENTMTCPFMGDHARYPLGPFRLAAMLDRPIVLMFGLYRGGNRYDIHFERLAVAPEAPAREALIEHSVESYVARLEHYCRLAPYNWFNFYDYWEKGA